jgi:DNA polymerase I-like protein with 3'-5' exonuclease and polymerase domains
LVRISNEIKKRGLDARIVACIHDSIWVETALAEESETRIIMEETMATALSLSVPLLSDFED